MPIGIGSDSHRLEAGRRLVLGGVVIPGSPHGPVARSDGDALLHALADALLSAVSAGDIGVLFPDDDPANAGLDSTLILAAAMQRVQASGFRVENASLVLVIDRPRIAPHRAAIEERVAALLGVERGRVGLTCKTSEGQSPGYVQAQAAVLLASA